MAGHGKKNQHYMKDNVEILKGMRYTSRKKRNSIIENADPDLIFSICEIFYNLIHFANRDHFLDLTTIKNVEKEKKSIGLLITPSVSLRRKKQTILENFTLQKILFTVGLDGYIDYVKNVGKTNKK